ncbi:hypothetical protein, partial [Vibrio cidicii]|uniref:hypothetical protein n=1 Tax=Vibrio cidicii TaxID=1763883 RepID=UPI0037046E27
FRRDNPMRRERSARHPPAIQRVSGIAVRRMPRGLRRRACQQTASKGRPPDSNSCTRAQQTAMREW